VITASKIHGCYVENDTLSVFVTTYYGFYKVYEPSNLYSPSAGIVPTRLTYIINGDGDYLLKDYIEAEDGDHWRPSIEAFCVYPSGKKIKGLSSKIVEHYKNYDDLTALHEKKRDDYLNSHGIEGYSITDVPPNIVTEPHLLKIDDDFYEDAADALELIYEDEHYQYFLSSVRSDKVMLTFDNGERSSLKMRCKWKRSPSKT
jgi:hypothetical protein